MHHKFEGKVDFHSAGGSLKLINGEWTWFFGLDVGYSLGGPEVFKIDYDTFGVGVQRVFLNNSSNKLDFEAKLSARVSDSGGPYFSLATITNLQTNDNFSVSCSARFGFNKEEGLYGFALGIYGTVKLW